MHATYYRIDHLDKSTGVYVRGQREAEYATEAELKAALAAARAAHPEMEFRAMEVTEKPLYR